MKPHLKISLIYLLIGMSYIAFSDLFVGTIVPDSNEVIRLQIMKGFGFVFVTTVILYCLIRRHVYATEQAEQMKYIVFKDTMAAVNHILNNFMNNMIYFKMQAESSGALSEQVLQEYDAVIYSTSQKIRELSELKELDSGTINMTAEVETPPASGTDAS